MVVLHFLFDKNLLVDCFNTAPVDCCTHVQCSDMMWALLLQSLCSGVCCEELSDLAVYHEGYMRAASEIAGTFLQMLKRVCKVFCL